MPTGPNGVLAWPSKYKYDFYIRGTAYGLEPYGGRVRDTARDNPR
jgi:hypothetical protein